MKYPINITKYITAKKRLRKSIFRFIKKPNSRSKTNNVKRRKGISRPRLIFLLTAIAGHFPEK